MVKFKEGDTIHKKGEKYLRPFKIEKITEDGYYAFVDKGLLLSCGCDYLYELVTPDMMKKALLNMFIQPLPPPKIELDEHKIREILESPEATSRFDLREDLRFRSLMVDEKGVQSS